MDALLIMIGGMLGVKLNGSSVKNMFLLIQAAARRSTLISETDSNGMGVKCAYNELSLISLRPISTREYHDSINRI